LTGKEAVDAILKLIEIIVSWPVIVLVVVLLVRSELPEMLLKLADRITKAPGGFEFGELKARMQDIETKIDRIEEKISFEPSSSLTPELQRRLELAISSFRTYLSQLGFVPPAEVRVRMQPGSRNAFYGDDCIVIDPDLANDPDIAFREYTHHALLGEVPYGNWSSNIRQIESGLADYFPCSFNNHSRLAERSAPVFGLGTPYIRELDNALNFSSGGNTNEPGAEMAAPQKVGEVWGGAFWNIRRILGQQLADQLLLTSWMSLEFGDFENNNRSDFVRVILRTATAAGAAERIGTIQSIFEARGLTI